MTTGLLKGNCLEQLLLIPDASVDSVVTDPPYELGFRGESWDNSGIAYNVELWGECLRVLKPGGHLLAFSGPRTYHRMVVAIEDSGFQIRDQIMWLYGTGFPKSLNVSKAIDKAAGLPATPEAQQWQGWGTGLKPAHEPIVVARKPLIGTVANNVLTYGTGALNIDGSRVGSSGGTKYIQTGNGQRKDDVYKRVVHHRIMVPVEGVGRWPANIIHDGSDEVLAGFPNEEWRFFYCSKVCKSERNAALDNNFHPTVKPLTLMRHLIKLVTPPNGVVLDPFLGSGSTAVAAILEGFDWIGCEMTEDYWPLIEARVEWAKNQQETMQ